MKESDFHFPKIPEFDKLLNRYRGMNIWLFRVIIIISIAVFTMLIIYSPLGWKRSIPLAISKTKGEICAEWFCFEPATTVASYTGGKEVHYCSNHIRFARSTITESAGGWIPLLTIFFTVGSLIVAVYNTILGFIKKEVRRYETPASKMGFGPGYIVKRYRVVTWSDCMNVITPLIVAFFAPWLAALLWG